MFPDYLPFPYGSKMKVETSTAIRYDNEWHRHIIVTWEQEDGLGLALDDMPKEMREGYLALKKRAENTNGIFDYKAHKAKGVTITIDYKDYDLFTAAKRIADGEKLNVLVADDEEKQLDLIQDMLSRQGFMTFEAQDGMTALEIFKKEKPHILIIDVHMPNSPIDGIETVRRIKAIDKEACFIVTTHIEDHYESLSQAKELGMLGYIVKPFNKERFEIYMQAATGFIKFRRFIEKCGDLSLPISSFYKGEN